VRRESDTHGPRQDDALKHELDGMLRGNGPNRAQEWREVEPTERDETEVTEPAGGDPLPPE
jgi:hypothetical protein